MRRTKRFYVISHERSGTHFLMNMLVRNLELPDGEAHTVPDWFGPPVDGLRRHLRYQRSLLAQRLFPNQNGIIKSHPERSLFERSYWSYPVVYIHRDPRDTLVSLWHHQRDPAALEYLRAGNPLLSPHSYASFSEFLRSPLSGFLRYAFSTKGDFDNVAARLARHLEGWLGAEHVHFVRYERLKLDPESVLNGISDFLGIPRSQHTELVKVNEMPSILPRKGIVGDWRNHFTDADEKFVRDTFESIGLDWEKLIWPAGAQKGANGAASERPKPAIWSRHNSVGYLLLERIVPASANVLSTGIDATKRLGRLVADEVRGERAQH